VNDNPDPYGEDIDDIRWRAECFRARRAADGRIYDDFARAVEDRRILIGEMADALHRYHATHLPPCTAANPAMDCTCGLNDLLRPIEEV
jgi:hypothetical protein